MRTTRKPFLKNKSYCLNTVTIKFVISYSKVALRIQSELPLPKKTQLILVVIRAQYNLLRKLLGHIEKKTQIFEIV